jgi:N utilization substance protein B
MVRTALGILESEFENESTARGWSFRLDMDWRMIRYVMALRRHLDSTSIAQATMTRRTRGREIALQVLYQTEQNSGLAPEEIRRFVERRLRGDKKLVEFAEALISGVQANKPRLDALISEVAENWRLDRMAAIDRNIIRLGAYEMLHCPEVPTKVAINEALELAKRYSTAHSSRFVNGILDRLQTSGGGSLSDAPAPEVAPEPES